MQSIRSIYSNLTQTYPDIHFVVDDTPRWSSSDRTVFHRNLRSQVDLFDLFHELGHALCKHHDYQQDIELVRMEREAWDRACQIALSYKTPIDNKHIETSLDTYRDWLHNRSRCPTCNAAGVQQNRGGYRCLICNQTWRATSITCLTLRRYKTKTTP